MNKFTWPFAAIVGMVLTFLGAIFWLIPKNMPEARTAMLGVIIAGANAAVLYAVALVQRQGERTSDKVDQLTRQTNGNMTTLINAKTQPAGTDVSRETSGHPGSDRWTGGDRKDEP